MTITDLRAAGEALYGPRWQHALARALGTSHRAIMYWLNGERGLPANLAERLDAVLIARITDLVHARRKLQLATRKAA